MAPAAAAERPARTPLYSPAERERRDSTGWTTVQAVLAPVQFLAFLVSVALVLRFLFTGAGETAADISVLVKTALLLTIMVTGSIWEKRVFGVWLFARPFFWEDVVSFGVIALHLGYCLMLVHGIGTPADRFLVALAGYAAYVLNAGQFLLKLRAARLDAAPAGSAA